MANLTPTPLNPPIRPQYIPPIGPPYTVVMAVNSCGLTTENQDQTFATEAFMDESENCKDISNEYLAECFKTFSGLTVGQGQIILNPKQKNKIKAFTRWVKYQYILGIDPTRLPFPETHTAELLRQANTHKLGRGWHTGSVGRFSRLGPC